MNAEIKNTCECCGNETTEALTLYPAYWPEPEQWICVECVKETERLLEELKDEPEIWKWNCPQCGENFTGTEGECCPHCSHHPEDPHCPCGCREDVE